VGADFRSNFNNRLGLMSRWYLIGIKGKASNMFNWDPRSEANQVVEGGVDRLSLDFFSWAIMLGIGNTNIRHTRDSNRQRFAKLSSLNGEMAANTGNSVSGLKGGAAI
jgi:hypothetical protein